MIHEVRVVVVVLWDEVQEAEELLQVPAQEVVHKPIAIQVLWEVL